MIDEKLDALMMMIFDYLEINNIPNEVFMAFFSCQITKMFIIKYETDKEFNAFIGHLQNGYKEFKKIKDKGI